ncbi:MAG: poly-beta,6-N-acetyl-D-glucosamine N-deacetylase PgaB [Herbaspirillum sp.]|nr:poly-beta,6-N-acetyl-D-glucosamine N-deacetylase PgaB [Herbaspirillum sp.]
MKTRFAFLRRSAVCTVMALLFLQSGATNAGTAGDQKSTQEYVALCYHAIPAGFNGDDGANSVSNFTTHLAWLRENGYTAISMDDVLQAKAGRKPLPERAYLLTLDGGYEDFYMNVFPILKAYKIPAVMAVVGRWIEGGPDPEESRLDRSSAKQQFVTWAQVKEMADSGLVEIASQSFDLHRDILANPQNNRQPAAITLRYDAATNTYETVEERRLRVRSDLRMNSILIKQHTGKLPRIMVWPYGQMDRIGALEAAHAGMSINLTLLDGFASVKNTEVVPRTLITKEMGLANFSYLVRHKDTRKEHEPMRAIRLSLDRIYDRDPALQEQKLGRLLDQAARLGVNTVLLQPFAGPAEDGAKIGQITETYFPNSVMHMRADLLNRVAWQMHTRLNAEVFLMLDPDKFARSGKNRKDVLKLYSEMSLHVPVQGLLFEGAFADVDLLAHMNYWPLPRIYTTPHQSALVNDNSDNFAFAFSFARTLPADRINVLSLSSMLDE